MARTETCHNCAYSFFDLGQWLVGVGQGFPSRPVCANHPDCLGRARVTPQGAACRNYRAKLPKPKGEVRQIPLGDGYYAYVDAADYEWLSRWTWHLCCGYAARWERKNGKDKAIFMHREIMQPPKGMMVDHKSRNKLDNTRENLRNATPAENTRNQGKRHGAYSSRFLGVSRCKKTGKWQARICVEGRALWLGLFTDELEAARAYDRAAVEYFGEFARLNFPEEWPGKRRRTVAKAKCRGDACVARTAKSGKASAGKNPARQTRSQTAGPKKAKRKTHDAKGRTKSVRVTGHRPRIASAKRRTTSRKGRHRAKGSP